MTPANNTETQTTAGLDQADEEILTYTVSDEALEAAAGTGEIFVPASEAWTRVTAQNCCWC